MGVLTGRSLRLAGFCYLVLAAGAPTGESFSRGGSAYATANRNLNLRVADPRLSENITEVDKELMIDAIRQVKIKRFIRQHEGNSWNHLPQYNFTTDKRTQLGIMVENGDIISSSAIHTTDKILKDAYGRAQKLIDFHQVDMEELMLQSVGALQELIEINKTLVTKFLQRTTISLQYLERRVNELTGSVAYLNTSVFEETKKAREDVVRLAEVEERLVFARIEEQRNRSTEGRKLADHSHTLALVLEQEKDQNENERLDKAHKLNIRVVYEKEKARRETELEIERIRNLTRVQAAKEAEVIAAEARIRQERLNEDIRLRMLEAQGKMDQKRWTAAIMTVSKVAGDAFYGFLGNAASVRTAVLIVVAIIAGIYFSREGSKLAIEKVREWLHKKPSLVRETSYLSMWAVAMKRTRSYFAGTVPLMDGIILNEALDFRLRSLASSLANTKKHGAPLRHILFHGPPGTGKTMVARHIAERSGLDYAIMSGGDVAPLKQEAVTEIHKLMKWSNNSSRGLMLFIDEAEAFVGTRSRAVSSEHLRNALNALLFHTGTQSANFMMVLATNRPQDLDPAIIDRVDDAMGFGLPSLREREMLCALYFKKYVNPTLMTQEEAEAAAAAASDAATEAPATSVEEDTAPDEGPSTRTRRGRGRKKKTTPKKKPTPKRRTASRRRRGRSKSKPVEAPAVANTSDMAWAEVANTNSVAATESKSWRDVLYDVVHRCFGKRTDIKTGGIYVETIKELAGRLEGFSGREIAKFMISVQALAYAQQDATITASVLTLLTDAKLQEHELKEKARENSDQY